MAVSAPQLRRLGELGADAWPAETTERLHGWRLGFTGGVSRRANSVLPNRWDGRVRLDAAVAEVEGRYRARRLRPCFKMTSASLPPDLHSVLDARGYRPEGSTRVLTATVGAVRTACSGAGAQQVRLDRAATPAWMATSWCERDRQTEVPVLRAVVERITAPHLFALAVRDGQAAGAGLLVLARGWGLLTAIYTLPGFRRAGVAQAVVGALAGWVDREGACLLYLQVEADNPPAQRLFRGCGFRSAYRYHYLAV